MSGVPRWALDRAADLSGCNHFGDDGGVLGSFAAYIAAHERAPADPTEALSEILANKFQWFNAGPGVVEDLAERGFKIVEQSS